MARRTQNRRGAPVVDVHTAQWELCEIGGYMHRHEGSPVARELRELRCRCEAELTPAVQAHLEAFAVLERHGAVDAFDAWRLSLDRCACDWRTTERAKERAR